MSAARPGPFERSTSVEEALGMILGAIVRGPSEDVPIAEAAGRVLAESIAATEDLWPFPRAAMDGVAVRAADVAGAAEGSPVVIRVVGAVYSGQVWSAPLQPGTAVRIATGAPMPPGADAVVPKELLLWSGDDVVIRDAMTGGRHVFPAGEDAHAHEVVLQAGEVLTGGHLGLLAAMGRGTVPVVRRASVAILATGDELVPPSADLRPGFVRESNSYALAAEVAGVGAAPRLLGIARDSAPELDRLIHEGLQVDALVVCGGASVGDRDLVRDALARAGVSMKFEGVSMKPGAPAAFGLAGSHVVFALPGTPGAARVAFEVLVRPALCAMMGHRDLHRPTIIARLATRLQVKSGRRRYLWGLVSLTPSGARVNPLSGQGTATLRSASEANALIVLNSEETDLGAGAQIPVLFLGASGLPAAQERQICALGVVGARGAGKSTLIERLIPALREHGLTVATVKHHAHGDMFDDGQTDTGRAGRAGAVATVLAGPGGIVWRSRAEGDPPLEQLLARIGDADIVLVEGYSQSSLPKILVRRSGVAADRPAPAGPVIAVVDDAPAAPSVAEEATPSFGWDAIEALGAFVAAYRTAAPEERVTSRAKDRV